MPRSASIIARLPLLALVALPAAAFAQSGAESPGHGTAPGVSPAATVQSATIDLLKTLLPLLSVPLSIIAFVVSRQDSSAKTEREKRDELKSAIEKLIDFRSELNEKFSTFANEQQAEAFSVMLNTRKSIYLQSAEGLAKSLDRVTPAEWMVLGNEYWNESNFAHAEDLLQRAVKAAEGSSATTQASALRAVAGAQIMLGADGLARARETFGRAIALLSQEADPYSRYGVALTGRMWAMSEWNLGHEQEALARLAGALAVLKTMPDAFPYRRSETRQCARMLIGAAEAFAGKPDTAAAARALDDAEAAIGAWTDDPSLELLGQVELRRAALAQGAGDPAAAARHAEAARALFEKLPAASTARASGLATAAWWVPAGPASPARFSLGAQPIVNTSLPT